MPEGHHGWVESVHRDTCGEMNNCTFVCANQSNTVYFLQLHCVCFFCGQHIKPTAIGLSWSRQNVSYGHVPYGHAPYGHAPYGHVPYAHVPYVHVPYGHVTQGHVPRMGMRRVHMCRTDMLRVDMCRKDT